MFIWTLMKMLNRVLLLGLVLVVLGGCSVKQPIEPPVDTQPPVEVPNKDLSFSLDGFSYTFPLKVEAFMNDGWEPTVALGDEIIEANAYIDNHFFRRGTSIVRTALYNPSDLTILKTKSNVSHIAFENRTFKTDVAPNILINDFLNFETTIDQIEEIFGKPTMTEDAVFEHYTFEIDNRNSLRVDFYKDRRDGNVSRWIILTSYNN